MPPDQTTPCVTEPTLAQLRSRLARLEAARSVKHLQRAFGYYVDQALWDEVADLFTADASLEVALDGVYKGRDRIRQYFYALGNGRRGLAYGELHECLQLQPVVHISSDGASAKARWRALVLSGRCGEHASWAEGPYENEYRCDHGVWKISRMHWYQTFQVPYDGGWAHNVDTTGGKLVSSSFPADAESTEPYEVWPGVYTPPFHYATIGAWSGDCLDLAVDEPVLAALKRRILRLEDAAAIENLISAYGYFLDKQQWDRLTDLFADDATMEISLRGVYVGRQSIRRALELFGPQGTRHGCLHNHLQLQPVIHVSDRGRAWARSRAFSQLGNYRGAALWHGAVYECEFVKIAGTWKYQRDHVYTTYFADYERGWAFGARAAPKPSDRIPPDLPPTEQYDVFPGRHVPPFHYPHPVTGAPIAVAAGRALVQQEALAALTADRVTGPSIESAAPETAVAIDALQDLEDAQAIEILQKTYGYFTDKALWSEAADLFTDGGVLEIAGVGAFVGKQHIRAYLTGQHAESGAPDRLFDIMQLQPIITVENDRTTARGRWRWFAQTAHYGDSAAWGLGTYESEYVKEDGVWRIRRLQMHLRLSAPYAGGWLHPAAVTVSPPRLAAPDLPPSIPARPYPHVSGPPCRFPHPVTGKTPDSQDATPPARHTSTA